MAGVNSPPFLFIEEIHRSSRRGCGRSPCSNNKVDLHFERAKRVEKHWRRSRFVLRTHSNRKKVGLAFTRPYGCPVVSLRGTQSRSNLGHGAKNMRLPRSAYAERGNDGYFVRQPVQVE